MTGPSQGTPGQSGPSPRGRSRLGTAAAVVRHGVGTGLGLVLAVLGWGFDVIVSAPGRLGRGLAELGAELRTTVSGRGVGLGLVLLLGLVALPGWAGRPVVVAATGVLWLAYAGQAWNLLAGGAGPVSLGHVLFVGLGAAAGAGLAPWLGLVPAGLVAMAAAAAVAAATGALAQRCGRDHGAVFTLLTLIFAEAGRLALTPLPRLGGGPGLGAAPGGPVAVYYLMLAMTLGLLVLSRLLLRSRRGRRWLAVREDPVTAAAIGIDPAGARLSALAVSAALTAPAGLVLAWGGLPAATDPLSWLTRSIEIGLVAMVGGVGTLIGPVLGAMVVAPAAAGLDWLALRPGHHPLPGLTGLGLGLALVLAVVVVPRGLWPGLARRLGLLAGERRR